ncbi:hypothetical protein TE10_22130 [Raoultella ornithinolytica]|uniref:hypothetical protein n=1 Tax=Raoultella ornithinolytica TaxID=54291 RepID=UPI0005981490|nr:hypothetical protein TE10_22130 [Raoultella ornithinolytica]
MLFFLLQKDARSVLHALPFYSLDARAGQILFCGISRSKSQNRNMIFLDLVYEGETHHDFVEPVSYLCTLPCRFAAR